MQFIKTFSSPKRRYLPVLRGFPAKYIYDPWNAPEGIQKVAKCLIGVNYPKPMVNHAEASRLNIERMKQIYQQLSRYRGLGMSVTGHVWFVPSAVQLSLDFSLVISLIGKRFFPFRSSCLGPLESEREWRAHGLCWRECPRQQHWRK